MSTNPNKIISLQELINAQVDAYKLEQIINDGPWVEITTRLGRKCYSIATIQAIIDQYKIKANTELKGLQEAIDTALVAGAGAAGWTASLVVDGEKTQHQINEEQKNKNAERISVLDFYKPSHLDHTQAILDGDAYCATIGGTLYFPSGVYLVSESIDKSSKTKWLGDGAPIFNMTVGDDEKRFLRPGYKHLISGSCIVWTGAQTKTITTTRTDRFSSFGYMLKTEFFKPNSMQGLGLICDVDCFDANGSLTTPVNDNRASYDVGVVVDNAMNSKFIDLSIFGYFSKKVGCVVLCRDLGLSNPDDNSFIDCTIFGGVAIVGYQGSPNAGLSGTKFIGGAIYDSTYHNRIATLVEDYLDQQVIFIDGQVSATTSINGHFFIGVNLRSTCPNPIQLDYCDNFVLVGCKTEFVLNAAYIGQTLTYILGTKNTENIKINGCRTFGTNWGITLRNLASLIRGSLVVDEDSSGKCFFVKNGKGVSYGSPNELLNEPIIQLSSDFSSVTKGWNFRYKTSSDQSFQINFDNSSKMSLDGSGNLSIAGRFKKIIGSGARLTSVISSGGITLTGISSYIALRGEGDLADDLVSISGGTISDIIVLVAYSASQPITIKHNISTIRLSGSTDFTLGTGFSNLTLLFNGTQWIEISRTVLS